MKIECKINIDLQEIQKEYKNKFLNNEDIYHYISENIDKSQKINLSFKDIQTEEIGNRGFLSQILEKFNQQT